MARVSDSEIRRLEKILDEEGDTPRARKAAERLEDILDAEAGNDD